MMDFFMQRTWTAVTALRQTIVQMQRVLARGKDVDKRLVVLVQQLDTHVQHLADALRQLDDTIQDFDDDD